MKEPAMTLLQALQEMTPLQALQNLDLVYEQLKAAPPELRCLAWFGICEVDRQRLRYANPGVAAMHAAMPAGLMANIVNDSRRGVPSPSSLAATPNAPQPEPRPKGSGFVEPAPLRSPPGVAILDRMMDVEAARERADRVINDAIRKPLK
jgi:hypothetical protein